MNALAKIASPVKNPRHSLETHCRNARWDLLQLLGDVEIAMARALGPTAPKMFSQKLKLVAEIHKFTGDLKSLIATRNLVAHAHVDLVERQGCWVSIWQIADSHSALNARTLNVSELKSWEDNATIELMKIVALLE